MRMSTDEQFDRLASSSTALEDLKGNSVRSAAYTAAASIASFVIRIGSTMVLARLVLPEHFGLLAMVAAVVAFAEQFRDLGLSTATIQAETLTRQQVSNLFWINVSCGGVITVVVAASAPVLAWFYNDERLLPVTLAIATTPFFGGLAVQHQALLSRQLKLGRTSSIRLISSLLSVLLAIGLAMAGAGYWALVAREVSRSFVVTVGMWLSCRWIPSRPARADGMRKIIGLGGNLTVANLLGSLVENVDKVLLGRLFGPVATGFYRQAQLLVTAPMVQVLDPLFQVVVPGLSSLQKNPRRYRAYFGKFVSVISLTTMPMSVLLGVYAREFTLILLGEQWLGAEELFRILCLTVFLTPSLLTAHWVLITLGRGQQYLILRVVEYIVSLGLISVGILFGAPGVAAAFPLTAALLLVPTLWYCFRDSPVNQKVFWAAVAKPTVSSMVLTGALLSINEAFPLSHSVLAVLRGGAMGVTVYLACFALLPGGFRELQAIVTDVLGAFRRKMVSPNEVSS